MRKGRYAAAVLAALTLAGCSGYGSPERAVQGVQDAIGRKDWKTALASFTPESQDQLVGGAVFFARVGSLANSQLKQILDKHGYDPNKVGSQADEGQDEPKAPFDIGGRLAEAVEANANAVDNKPAFFSDMMDWADRTGSHAGNRFDVFRDTELTGVKVEGDTATGTLRKTAAGVSAGVPIRFKQIYGRWYIELP